MSDRSILFSAPMVDALLAGRKTQTRRSFRLPSWAANPPEFEIDDDGVNILCEETGCFADLPRVPRIGDRLWVREAWRTSKVADELKPSQMVGGSYTPVWYEHDRDNCDVHGRYRHARHMPKWASRLTLTVTDVRIERLQYISEADAIAEGIEHSKDQPGDVSPGWRNYCDPRWRYSLPTPRSSYATLWDSINGNGAWDANPWVVAISFNVTRGNINVA